MAQKIKVTMRRVDLAKAVKWLLLLLLLLLLLS